ncbi:hypothetical protein KKB99_07540 [bacterium]|nr:hypothetical protein [bacterium]MBU1025845.1 hypothetical protein [bacterium]
MPSMENLDFSKAIEAGSMKEVYENIYDARCDCGGELFPGGPVSLESPDKSKEKVIHKLMFLNCSKCLKEIQQIYALDTSTKEYHDEQVKGRKSNQRWGRLASGNPIDLESL